MMLKILNFLETKKANYKNNKAQSMIELIVAVAIIAIIIMIAMPDVRNTIFNTRTTACEAEIKVIGNAILQHYTETGVMPESNDIVNLKEELTHTKEINGRQYGPWMKKNMNTTDPWGNPYTLEYDGNNDFDVVSGGERNSAETEIRYSTLGNKD